MPDYKTADVVNDIYRGQPTFFKPNADRVDAPAEGRLGAHKVKDTPKNFEHPWTFRGRNFCNNWTEVRNLGSACLGSLEFATPYVGEKDSTIVAATKVIACSAYPFFLHNFNFKGWTSRLGAMMKDLNTMGKVDLKNNAPGYNGTLFNDINRGPTALHATWSMTMFFKRAYDVAYDTVADVAWDKERQEMQTLLKDYDPVRQCFIDPVTKAPYEAPDKIARLQELMDMKNTWNTPNGGNIYRSRSQRALDSLALIRDNFGTLISSGVPNVISTFAKSGTSVATGGNLLAGVGHAYLTVNNLGKVGVQMSAISNIEHARLIAKAKVQDYKLRPDTVKPVVTNRLIEACANRMIQERSYQTRLGWWQAVFFGMSSSSTLMSGAGVVAPVQIALSLTSMLGLTVTTAIAAGFERIHGRKLAIRRVEASAELKTHMERYNQMNEAQKLEFIESLDCQDKMAFLEHHLHDRLRNGTHEEQVAVYRFFQACGISNNTIKSMMVMKDATKSLAVMRKQMYSDRVKHSFKNTMMLKRTVGYVSGVTYLHRRRLGGESELTEKQVAEYLAEDAKFNASDNDDDIQEARDNPDAYAYVERVNPFKKRQEDEENEENQVKPLVKKARTPSF